MGKQELAPAAAAWLVVCVASIPTLALVLAWRADHSLSFEATCYSTLFMVLCIPNTLLLVHAHTQHWVQPQLQLCVVRIVLMVPIYAIDSWLGLTQRGIYEARVLATTSREFYEAFVIYNFVTYLIAYFGSERELGALLASKPAVHHLWPLRCVLPRWRMGPRYLSICRRGALQYVAIRLATSFLSCASILLQTAWRAGWPKQEAAFTRLDMPPLFGFINGFSQMWAMYCLLMFYRAVSTELAPLRPIAKFLCVKSVVFLTFWQTTALDMLNGVGVIPSSAGMSADETTDTLKDATLCAEMFAFSLLHPLARSLNPRI